MQAKKITGSPNKILDKLKKVLKPHPSETYTIAIWKSDGTGGHAVTPYEVKYNGDGQYQVLIYDNNWPGQTRAIAFDTNKDTWSYDAAANPSDPTELYEGDADTKTLVLFPTSPGQGTQPCPFCGTVPKQGSTAGTTGGGAAPRQIYLTGSATNHSHVLVTDQAGHRLGYVNGKLVNEIPGAHYVLLTSDQDWKNKLEPILYVPANVAYTITLDGTPLTAPDTESIGIIGPSWHIAINDIPMHPGRQGHPDGRPQRHQADLPHHSGPVPHHRGRGVGHPGPLRLRHRRRLQPAGQHHQPQRPRRRRQPDHQQRRLDRGVEREPPDDPRRPSRACSTSATAPSPSPAGTPPSFSSATGPTPARASPSSPPTTGSRPPRR